MAVKGWRRRKPSSEYFLAISSFVFDGLVYVCDRLGDRIEVFDKMGNFKRNIRIQSKTAHDAFVPVTVGNVHVALDRVDRDLRLYSPVETPVR